MIDDDADIRRVASLSLARVGKMEVVDANGGLEGVRKAAAEKPDAILLDVMMPEMNGIETLRELKTRDATRDIPVIMVTTKSEEEMKRECRQLGAFCFVTKPIDRDELRLRVKEAVGG